MTHKKVLLLTMLASSLGAVLYVDASQPGITPDPNTTSTTNTQQSPPNTPPVTLTTIQTTSPSSSSASSTSTTLRQTSPQSPADTEKPAPTSTAPTAGRVTRVHPDFNLYASNQPWYSQRNLFAGTGYTALYLADKILLPSVNPILSERLDSYITWGMTEELKKMKKLKKDTAEWNERTAYYQAEEARQKHQTDAEAAQTKALSKRNLDATVKGNELQADLIQLQIDEARLKIKHTELTIASQRMQNAAAASGEAVKQFNLLNDNNQNIQDAIDMFMEHETPEKRKKRKEKFNDQQVANIELIETYRVAKNKEDALYTVRNDIELAAEAKRLKVEFDTNGHLLKK